LRIKLLVSEDCEASLGKFCELLEKFFIGCGEIETRFTLHSYEFKKPSPVDLATT